MLPLIVLIAVFMLMLLVTKIARKSVAWSLAGRVAMAVMLLLTASGHFMYAEAMEKMLPPVIPYGSQVILLTGIIEIMLGIAFLFRKWQLMVAWLLIAFFIAVLPANIYAAMHEIDYTNIDNAGPGLEYLWFRVPLQVFFIIWAWWFGIRLQDRP